MADDRDEEIRKLHTKIKMLEDASPVGGSPPTKPSGVGMGAKLVLFTIGGFVLLVAIAALTPPKTIGDLAKQYAADCVRDKGSGNWHGSMGISLEKFCEGAGDLQALEEDRKEHPENY